MDTGYRHALVHLDIESPAGVSVATSLLLSNPFTSEGQCAIHFQAFERSNLVTSFSRSFGPLSAALSSTPSWTVRRSPLSELPLQVEGRGARFELSRAGADFHVEIDVGEVELRADFTQLVSGVDLGAEGPLAFGSGEAFTAYRIEVPLSDVTGHLRVGDETLPIAGRAYLDAQWGSVHYNAGLRSWEWYRVDLPDERVYVMSDQLVDGRRRRRALIVSGDGVRVCSNVRRSQVADQHLVDSFEEYTLTLTTGEPLQDDDLSELSSGRVPRFLRLPLDVQVEREGALVGEVAARVGRIWFRDPANAGSHELVDPVMSDSDGR